MDVLLSLLSIDVNCMNLTSYELYTSFPLLYVLNLSKKLITSFHDIEHDKMLYVSWSKMWRPCNFIV